MIIEEDVYIEHYGVKGMQWGVRKQQAASAARAAGRGGAVAGKAAWRGTKAVGRGTKKTALWVKDHPTETALIGLGAAYVGLRMRAKVKTAQANRAAIQASRLRIKDMAKASQTASGSRYVAMKAKAFKAIPMGPIGSTSPARLNGALPMPRAGSNTLFEARDATGKVVSRIGTAVSPETLRALRGG